MKRRVILICCLTVLYFFVTESLAGAQPQPPKNLKMLSFVPDECNPEILKPGVVATDVDVTTRYISTLGSSKEDALKKRASLEKIIHRVDCLSRSVIDAKERQRLDVDSLALRLPELKRQLNELK